MLRIKNILPFFLLIDDFNGIEDFINFIKATHFTWYFIVFNITVAKLEENWANKPS